VAPKIVPKTAMAAAAGAVIAAILSKSLEEDLGAGNAGTHRVTLASAASPPQAAGDLTPSEATRFGCGYSRPRQDSNLRHQV
jgi:hypothetical protein